MRNTSSVAAHIVGGSVAFAAAQLLLFLLAGQNAAPAIDNSAWFLNSGRGVLITTIVLALAAAAMGLGSSPPGLWSATVAFSGGAAAAMVVVLFALGPGTIFPIVIAIGMVIIAVAAITGAVIARSVRSRFGSPLA
jgi:hypothetical protein